MLALAEPCCSVCARQGGVCLFEPKRHGPETHNVTLPNLFWERLREGDSMTPPCFFCSAALALQQRRRAERRVAEVRSLCAAARRALRMELRRCAAAAAWAPSSARSQRVGATRLQATGPRTKVPQSIRGARTASCCEERRVGCGRGVWMLDCLGARRCAVQCPSSRAVGPPRQPVRTGRERALSPHYARARARAPTSARLLRIARAACAARTA